MNDKAIFSRGNLTYTPMYDPTVHAITWLFFCHPVSHPPRFIFSIYSGDLENFQYVKSYLSHITRHILWFFNAGQSAISAVMLVRMYIKIVHRGCTQGCKMVSYLSKLLVSYQVSYQDIGKLPKIEVYQTSFYYLLYNNYINYQY